MYGTGQTADGYDGIVVGRDALRGFGAVDAFHRPALLIEIFFDNLGGQSGDFVGGFLHRTVIGHFGVDTALQTALDSDHIPGMTPGDLLSDAPP